MAFTGSITTRFVGPTGTVENTVSKSSSASISVDETIANGQTAFQINVAIDVSAVKAFYICADQNVTVKTNSSGSPDDTLNLIANEPYAWHNTSLSAFLLDTDVTAIFVANASGSAAALTLRVIQDASP